MPLLTELELRNRAGQKTALPLPTSLDMQQIVDDATEAHNLRNPIAQPGVEERLLDSMVRMHRQVVHNLINFADQHGKQATLTPILSHLFADVVLGDLRKVLAYDKSSLQAFMKLLTFFALAQNDQAPKPELAAKVASWYSQAQPIFTELKLQRNTQVLMRQLGEQLTQPTADKNFKRMLSFLPSYMKHNLRTDIYKKLGEFHAEKSEVRTYLTKLFTYYNSASEDAYRHIVNNVGILNEPALTGEVEPVGKQTTDEAKKNVIDFVKQLGGKSLLTIKQEETLKAKNLEQWKEYRKRVVALGHSRKLEIKKLVRASGKDKLPASVIDAAMIKLGIPNDFIPEGFDGFYDEDSNMYSKKGERFAANIGGGKYKVNPHYDPKSSKNQYMAKHWNPANNKGKGGWGLVYSYEHVFGKRGEKKADIAAENTANLPAIRAAWRHDMHNSKDHEESAHAHLMEALYHTSSRIGSGEGMTDGKRTYGMRTILKKHVRGNGDGSLTLTFPGKSGMINKLRIKPQDKHSTKLVNYIKEKTEDKGPNEPVWTHGPKNKEVSNSKATTYLQSLGWKSGAHKLRYMKGNELANNYLIEHPLPKRTMTAQEVKAYVEKLGLIVGNELGHKRTNKDTNKQEPVSTTALKSYIDPALIASIYQKKQVPLPKWLEKMVHSDND